MENMKRLTDQEKLNILGVITDNVNTYMIPQGSGFDYKYLLSEQKNAILLSSEFTVYNEPGYRLGSVGFTVKFYHDKKYDNILFTVSFVDWNINNYVTGYANRLGIKEYIEYSFWDLLAEINRNEKTYTAEYIAEKESEQNVYIISADIDKRLLRGE